MLRFGVGNAGLAAAAVRGLGLALALALGTATAGARGASWTVTVRNPGGATRDVPVRAPVPDDLPVGEYLLRPQGSGEAPTSPARVYREGTRTYLGAVLRALPARGTATFALTPETKSEQSAPGVELRPSGPNVEVLVGGKPLMTYRAGEATKPYYSPVFGPNGEEITRAYPMRKDVAGEDRDHNHQRSFWFTHGNVNGVDFWASDPLNGDKPNFGSIKETSRRLAAGSGVGVIRTTDDWLDHSGKKVLEDERVVRVYDTAGARILDFDITLKATAGPVTFGDTKEGMFGLRVASSMDVNKKKGGKITNAEGVTDDAAWGKASPWVDYTGPVKGQTLGVAVLNHPDSFRHPTTWHVRTYGLFAANPFGWKDFGLKKTGEHAVPAGESIRFRYRVIFHEGDTESARIADAYRAYAEPPAVELKAE